MFKFQALSSRVIAAATSVAFTIVIFATAIMPANHGTLLPIGIA